MHQRRSKSTRGSGRTAALAVLAAVAGFSCLIVLAMRAYPGGNAWDATARGHDFWLNYLCDLERHTALDGHSNATGAAFAQAGMILLGIGSFWFWRLLPQFIANQPRLVTAVRRLGCASSFGTIAVGLLPADEFADVHPWLMLVGGGTGIAAATCAAVGLGISQWRTLQGIGAVVLLVSAVDLGLYLRQLFVDTPAPIVLAVLERIALVGALVWQVVVAAIVVRGEESRLRGSP